jgi:hypothetical protein
MNARTLIVSTLTGVCILMPTTAARAYSGYAPKEILLEMAANELIINKPTAGGKSGTLPQNLHHLPEVVFLQPGEYFTNVAVYGETAIAGIELHTSSGRTLHYAHVRGSGEYAERLDQPPFDLNKGQYISQIDVQQGKIGGHTVITSITFHIKNSDGTPEFLKAFGQTVYGGKTTLFAAAPANEICGFWGWYGSAMDCIGVVERQRK